MEWTKNDDIPKDYLQTADTPESYTQNIDSNSSDSILTSTDVHRMSTPEVQEYDFMYKRDFVNNVWVKLEGVFRFIQKHGILISGKLMGIASGASFSYNFDLREDEILDTYMAFVPCNGWEGSDPGDGGDGEGGGYSCTAPTIKPKPPGTMPAVPSPPAYVADGIIPTPPEMPYPPEMPHMRGEPEYAGEPEPEYVAPGEGAPVYNPPTWSEAAPTWTEEPPTYEGEVPADSYQYMWVSLKLNDGFCAFMSDSVYTNPTVGGSLYPYNSYITEASGQDGLSFAHVDFYGGWADFVNIVKPDPNVRPVIEVGQIPGQNQTMPLWLYFVPVAAVGYNNYSTPEQIAFNFACASGTLPLPCIHDLGNGFSIVIKTINNSYQYPIYPVTENGVCNSDTTHVYGLCSYVQVDNASSYYDYLVALASYNARYALYELALADWTTQHNAFLEELAAYDADYAIDYAAWEATQADWLTWYNNTYLPALEHYNRDMADFNEDHRIWEMEFDYFMSVLMPAWEASLEDYAAALEQYNLLIVLYNTLLAEYDAQHARHLAYEAAKEIYDTVTYPNYLTDKAAWDLANPEYVEDIAKWHEDWDTWEADSVADGWIRRPLAEDDNPGVLLPGRVGETAYVSTKTYTNPRAIFANYGVDGWFLATQRTTTLFFDADGNIIAVQTCDNKTPKEGPGGITNWTDNEPWVFEGDWSDLTPLPVDVPFNWLRRYPDGTVGYIGDVYIYDTPPVNIPSGLPAGFKYKVLRFQVGEHWYLIDNTNRGVEFDEEPSFWQRIPGDDEYTIKLVSTYRDAMGDIFLIEYYSLLGAYTSLTIPNPNHYAFGAIINTYDGNDWYEPDRERTTDLVGEEQPI